MGGFKYVEYVENIGFYRMFLKANSGQVTSTKLDNRELQLALKYYF